MKFDVAGPFEIVRYGKKKNITKDSISVLRGLLEERQKGLSDSCGCYIFAKRAGKGVTPWYIGQACKTPMLKEALNSDNITKYNKVIDDKGTPLLYVLPAITASGKLKKRPSGAFKALDFLERWLIAEALEKNPNLINSQETRLLRGLHVVGIFNPKKGEATADSQNLKGALW